MKSTLSIHKFRIICNHGDSETLKYAMEIKDFLIKSGYEYLGFISHNSILNGSGHPEVQIHDNEIDIIIGSNIDSGKPLQEGGGMSMGMGKI